MAPKSVFVKVIVNYFEFFGSEYEKIVYCVPLSNIQKANRPPLVAANLRNNSMGVCALVHLRLKTFVKLELELQAIQIDLLFRWSLSIQLELTNDLPPRL